MKYFFSVIDFDLHIVNLSMINKKNSYYLVEFFIWVSIRNTTIKYDLNLNKYLNFIIVVIKNQITPITNKKLKSWCDKKKSYNYFLKTCF